MTARARPPQIAAPRPTVARGLFAALGAPVAWMLALLVSYATSDLMCDAGSGDTAIRIVLAAVSGTALLVAVAAGLVAASVRRRTGDADPVEPGEGRQRTLATVGLLTSVIFGVAILQTMASGLFATAC